jgi:multicomponent Na+:H+ antiporter subunit C
MTFLPYAVAVWIFIVGLYGIVTSRHIVHLVVSLAVTQSSTYVFLLAVGYKEGGAAPYFQDIPVGRPAVDPLVQAFAMVDIVVGATATALLLALAVQAHKRTGVADPDALETMKG